MDKKLSPPTQHILVLNSGSSSLKFAVYAWGANDRSWLSGKLARIGLPDAYVELRDSEHNLHSSQHNLPDHSAALTVLVDWLGQQPELQLKAVGHRLVHGGANYQTPQRVTAKLLTDLKPLIPFAPDHLPAEISLIEAVDQLYPNLPQVVCFDTAFHQTMPDRARRLPIPRHLAEKGIVRYGFHGLSYEYVLDQLAQQAGTQATQERVVLAHLGNGASMVAVRSGKSIDTTMGFTPTGGLMMGTRSGDLDPGVLLYLLANGYATSETLSHLLNDESGLRGVSGISSDMQTLLNQAPKHRHAADAIDLFCYLAQKQLGGLVAALNGLDTLVFTGGIGENSPEIRARICSDLQYSGIGLDAERNRTNASIISPEGQRPVVRVIPTNEEYIIAQQTQQLLYTEYKPINH
ncbi:acetate/propionate family kinase [Spirosoma sp. SC4-14]|uniref:acetate/propionate family kinase n=1 Tax=Spirosoma sp. SC4-14 TaxID=3128900 RepID=UPI0030CFC115